MNAVSQVNKFLNTSCSEEVCAAIADACSFSKLKKADEEVKKNPFYEKTKIQMYRKGMKKQLLVEALVKLFLFSVFNKRYDII